MGDTNKNQAVRIFLWIVPRVTSTALLKCMSFVEDTSVWLEPYMTCFLRRTMLDEEHRRDDPTVKRITDRWQKSMQRPEAVKVMEEGIAKAAKYSNLYPQATFT